MNGVFYFESLNKADVLKCLEKDMKRLFSKKRMRKLNYYLNIIIRPAVSNVNLKFTT